MVIIVVMISTGNVHAAEQLLACDFKKISTEVSSAFDGDSKSSIDYEFCIPYQDKYLIEIKKIEPSINCFHGSGGRIGCTNNEYLCIGNTHLKNSKNTLCQLSSREYIQRIDPCYWE